MSDIERRVSQSIETRQEDDSRRIVGHAALFNQPTEIMEGFTEVIEPGAFARALRENQDVRALFNHDASLILGRTTAGTLRLSEDEQGLRYEIDPADTQLARDLSASIERGDISQSSFGFIVRDQMLEIDEDDNVTRTIRDVDLFDVSPVTFPATDETDVALRMKHEMKEERNNGVAQEIKAKMKLRDLESLERQLQRLR